jgi:hypothetical protein
MYQYPRIPVHFPNFPPTDEFGLKLSDVEVTGAALQEVHGGKLLPDCWFSEVAYDRAEKVKEVLLKNDPAAEDKKKE